MLKSNSIRSFTEDERCRFRPIKENGIRVVIRLTMSCDLSCPHCLAENKQVQNELSFKEWKDILTQLPDINAKKVLLTGGEPLIRKDIVQFVQLISKLKIPVDLNSNLQKMTPELMLELKNAGLTEISVSLEGPEAVHDKMHGKPGAYQQLINAIGWANEFDIPVDAACCVTNENIDYLEQLIEQVYSLKIKSLTISRMFPIGHGAKYQNSPDQPRLNELYQNLVENIIPEAPLPIRVVGLLNPPEKKDCLQGKSLIGINPDGSLSACFLSEYSFKELIHPIKVGLKQSYLQLSKSFERRTFLMCWRRNE